MTITTQHKFAGTYIFVQQEINHPLRFICTPLNKNLKNLREHSSQAYPRYIPAYSMVPENYQTGMQIGTYIRLLFQSDNKEILVNAIIHNAFEMYTIGYKAHIWSKAFYTSLVGMSVGHIHTTK